MIRELTEWEESFSDKIKKLNDDVTLDVITHFIKQLKLDYAGYSEIKAYLTELQKDIVENLSLPLHVVLFALHLFSKSKFFFLMNFHLPSFTVDFIFFALFSLLR